MLWSIDSYQNRVSADQYHLTVPRAQVSTHRSRVFFEVNRWQITSIKWSLAQVYFFQWFISNMLCWLCIIRILISNWPRTRKFSQFFEIQAGKTFSYHGHTLVTLYVQFLCSDRSKFDRWAHAENLCSILKVVYFDSWSWQSFVSTCDVFNCLDVQNEIQLLSGVFFWYSWLVCLLGFWLRNTSLVKVRNPISDSIVFVFTLRKGVAKSEAVLLALLDTLQELNSNGKPG